MFDYRIFSKPKDMNLKKEIISEIFKITDNAISKKQKGTLNIVFLDDDSIRSLNKQYRSTDSSTDVLSFHYFDDFSELKKTDIAGEIILSQTKIRYQSAEFSNTLEEEFYKLLIHSILHILGYDHESDSDYEIMKSEEDNIIKKIFDKFQIKIN